jgi:hypothetical protein
MPESMPGEVIVANLDYELRPQRLPFGGFLRTPSARPARSAACEARRLDKRLQFARERWTAGCVQRRRKTDVMEQPP